MFAGEVRRYEQTFSDSEAVYLDQFSLIVFFAHHNQERWTSLDGGRYEVREDAKRIVVLRDPHWNVEFLKEELYEELAIRLRASKLESVTLFSVRHRSPPSLPWGAVEQEAFCRRVSVLAARHGLKIEALVLDGWSVFAQFAL
jgi:UDP-N-acetylmuramate-alanine ligase